MTPEELVQAACAARKRAYAPYSRFTVGAALLCKNGKVFCGCNVENAAFSPTCCAERTAFFSAVADGEHEFSAIAVVGAKAEEAPTDFCAPCGVCRQVMREFCADDFEILLFDGKTIRKHTLKEIFPLAFSENLLNL